MKGVEETLTAGDLVVSFGKRAQYLANMRTLIEILLPSTTFRCDCFVQGFSRGMVMEKIVWEFWQSWLNTKLFKLSMAKFTHKTKNYLCQFNLEN